MSDLWGRALWHFYRLAGSIAFSSRAKVYALSRQRHLDWRQAAEAYQLTRSLSVPETVAFFDSVTPGSRENAMRMLRAVRDPAYFTGFVIDARYASAQRDAAAQMRRASPLFGNPLSSYSMGYEDVIRLSEAGVSANEAQKIAPYMPVGEVISCSQKGVPAEYAIHAAQAGYRPSEAWGNGLPLEYLV